MPVNDRVHSTAPLRPETADSVWPSACATTTFVGPTSRRSDRRRPHRQDPRRVHGVGGHARGPQVRTVGGTHRHHSRLVAQLVLRQATFARLPNSRPLRTRRRCGSSGSARRLERRGLPRNLAWCTAAAPRPRQPPETVRLARKRSPRRPESPKPCVAHGSGRRAVPAPATRARDTGRRDHVAPRTHSPWRKDARNRVGASRPGHANLGCHGTSLPAATRRCGPARCAGRRSPCRTAPRRHTPRR